MPKYTVNAGYSGSRTFEADAYNHDEHLVTFYASDGRQVGSFATGKVTHITIEG